MINVIRVTGEGHVLRITYTELDKEYTLDNYNSKYPDFDYAEEDPTIPFNQNGTVITIKDYEISIDVQDLVNEKIRNQGAAMNAVSRELYAQETSIENFVFALSRKLEELNPDFERKELWDILQKEYYDELDDNRQMWDKHLANESESLHMGDCTKFACSCSKCEFEQYIRKAQKVFLEHL